VPLRHGKTSDVSAPGVPEDGAATEAARDEFLRQILDAYERGVLDLEQYTDRVAALESAVTVTDMAAVAARAPTVESVGDRSAVADLDPVDLARLAATPARTSGRGTRSRYRALVAVVIVFVVMILAGLWFASRLHVSSQTGGDVVPRLLTVAAS